MYTVARTKNDGTSNPKKDKYTGAEGLQTVHLLYTIAALLHVENRVNQKILTFFTHMILYFFFSPLSDDETFVIMGGPVYPPPPFPNTMHLKLQCTVST